MTSIRVLRGDPAGWEAAGPTAVSIGVFDGVHLGHRRVLAGLVAEAGEIGVLPAVLTFDPHPLEILNPERAPGMLTTIEQRIEQFEQLGIGLVGVIAIGDVRHLLPDEFARQVLFEKLSARQVTVGADFRFGKGREGDAELLRSLGAELGWTVDVVDMFGMHHGVVSSTLVRRLLSEGDVVGAAALLGRPYEVVGRVVGGDKRGRDLGFPTANLEVHDRLVIPGDGVYAGRIRFTGQTSMAAVNVGVRPTFGTGQRLVEAFVLDFDGDLYGKTVGLSFITRLRDELKFDEVADLVTQIAADVEKTRELLG